MGQMIRINIFSKEHPRIAKKTREKLLSITNNQNEQI